MLTSIKPDLVKAFFDFVAQRRWPGRPAAVERFRLEFERLAPGLPLLLPSLHPLLVAAADVAGQVFRKVCTQYTSLEMCCQLFSQPVPGTTLLAGSTTMHA